MSKDETGDNTKLEFLLDKACGPEDEIDITALDGFCIVIQTHTKLSHNALQLIGQRIQSSNENVVLKSLKVLEECIDNCGAEFQSEVGKFKFLNLLIKLVSKNHSGNTTPKAVVDKILDLLLIWSVKYSHEVKIKEAYEMLRKQKHFVHEPAKNILNIRKPTPVPPMPRHHDDEMGLRLRKLLQSKDPMDIQAANLLIQNKVREEETKTHMHSIRLLEIQKVPEHVSVLNAMLDNYVPNESTEDELNTIRLLHKYCQDSQPTIQRLAQEMTENGNNLDEILAASDQVSAVLDRFNAVINENRPQPSLTKSNLPISKFNQQDPSSWLLELDSSASASSTSNNLLENTKQNDVVLNEKELAEALGYINIGETDTNAMGVFDILQPIKNNDMTSFMAFDDNKKDISPTVAVSKTNGKKKGLFELDEIVKGMFESTSKEDAKDTRKSVVIEDDLIIDAGKNDLIPESKNLVLQDDDDDDDVPNMLAEIENIPEVVEPIAKDKKPTSITSLTGIKVDLDDITPSIEPERVVLNDEHGLKLIFNFSKDHPLPDVSIIVVTVMNQGKEEISMFHLDASISKFCRIRFLPPSGTTLPGVKPFRPPSEIITQILLYSNANREDRVSMVCNLSYYVGDDPNRISTSFKVNDLQFLFD